MKFVLAPDSFKGSLSSGQACEGLERGVKRVFPDADIVALPLADGGEGTLDSLIKATQGRVFTARVRGPLDEAIEAQWGLLPAGKAVVELAQASGLTLVTPPNRDAMRASTYGTGQLIKAVLNAGSREILVCLGGSATTDGGSGALSALGARFFDENDCVLPPGGGALPSLKRIDLKFFDSRLQKAQITLLCDVINPLTGPTGAAWVYGAQKGANGSEVAHLDAGLENLADVTFQTCGQDLRALPGAGAAGGTAFGLLSFCRTTLRSGIEVVLEAVNFREALENADYVLTGEGSVDAQTVHGKTIAGICRTANEHNISVVAFGGTVQLSGPEMDEIGLRAAFALADGPRSLEYCLKNAAFLLETATERALRLLT